MVTGQSDDRRRAAAEAAAWHAHLQGADVSENTRAAFEDWRQASPLHGEAFASASDIWSLLPEAVSASPRPRRVMTPRRVPGRVQGLALAACLLLSIGLGVYVVKGTATVYETGRGEQQVVALKDGTQVTLNTDSRIRVRFSDKVRQVALERGEALFDVTHDPEHPFIVEAGAERVRVLGTSFVLRQDAQAFSVTLIDGRLELTGPQQVPVILSPGERAVVRDGQGLHLDQPQIQAVTAWQKGEIILSDASLAEAVQEFNRYGAVPIVLAGPEVGALRISGVFQTDKGAEFATTAAALNGLRVRKSEKAIELSQ